MTPSQSIFLPGSQDHGGSQVCAVCGAPIEYKGTGRRPLYCKRRCKKAAERKRARFALFRPRRQTVSPSVSAPAPAPERQLTREEAEAILGRPLYSGDWLGYLGATGRRLGGTPR
jgi:hypothetical protein